MSMEITAQTAKAHRQDKIAKGIIWAFVILTIAILAWIVLYVLYRGFVSVKHVYYPVTDAAEEQFAPADYPDLPLQIITHPGVRLKDDLTGFELFELYTKGRRPNWGDLTGQNQKVTPFLPAEASAVTRSAAALILGEEEEFSRHVEFLPSPEAVIEAVRSTKGAVGMIPAAEELSLRGVKTIPYRRITAPVNPSVRKIVDNRQIQEIKTDDLQGIFQGETRNWQELGGIDLTIQPVLFSPETPVYGGLTQLLWKDFSPSHRVIEASSREAFYEILESTPGAVGLSLWDDVAHPDNPDMTLLSFDRLEIRRNLDIYFLLEAPARSGKWGGISTIIINTLFLVLFTLLFSTPVGVLGAIYLVEYAKQNRLVRILRLGTETLAGIPSIVFGLFGFIFFVDILGFGIGFISAVLTVTMMILPTIIRTSEEALKSVPLSYREGSLALGATKLQTIIKVVIPAATPGILTGIILAVGRTVGETAVLVYTLGSNYELVRGPSSSARVLSLHLYNLFAEAISFDRSFATGAILIFIIIIVNYSTTQLIGQLNRKAGKK